MLVVVVLAVVVLVPSLAVLVVASWLLSWLVPSHASLRVVLLSPFAFALRLLSVVALLSLVVLVVLFGLVLVFVVLLSLVVLWLVVLFSLGLFWLSSLLALSLFLASKLPVLHAPSLSVVLRACP